MSETIRDVVLLEADTPEMAHEIARNAPKAGFDVPVALDPEGAAQADGHPKVGTVRNVRARGRAVVADLDLLRGAAAALRGSGARLRAKVYTGYRSLGRVLQRIDLLGTGIALTSLGAVSRLFAERDGEVRAFEAVPVRIEPSEPIRMVWSEREQWFVPADAPRSAEALIADLVSAFKSRDAAALSAILQRVVGADPDLEGAVRQAQVNADAGRWDVLRRVLVHITDRLRAPHTTRGGVTMTFASGTGTMSQEAAGIQLAALTRTFCEDRYGPDYTSEQYGAAMRMMANRHPALKAAYAPMPGDAPVVVDTASEEVRDRVRAFRANNPGVEYGDAMHRVLDADPALKKRYLGDAPAGPVIVEEPSARPDDRLLALMREIKAEFPGITHARAMEIAKKRDPALWVAYARS